MVPQLQKHRITEIQVRIDCNGCVRKIKKALNGINGIYDMYIDFPQQKLTIIGWADPEKIVKAIKKTRKIATICSRVEAAESPPQQTEKAASDAMQQPRAETLQTQPGPPAKPPTCSPPPLEQSPPDTTPQTPSTGNNARQQSQSNPGTQDVGEVHRVIYRHPPSYRSKCGSGHSYNGHWNRFNNNPVFIQVPPRPYETSSVFIREPSRPYNNNPVFIQEPPTPYNNNPVFISETPSPMYVIHSYNTYRPSPYVTEYEYVRSPPRHTYYNHMENYNGDNHNSNGNLESIFSDENPNACRIV